MAPRDNLSSSNPLEVSMTSSPLVLAADVGGTNTKLALARVEARRATIVKRCIYPSPEYATLELAVGEFLSQTDTAPLAAGIAAACIAVAGPVEGGRARFTNLAWRIEEAELADRLAIPRLRVINDFSAAALGLELLGPDDFLTLQEGTRVEGAQRVIVGAGTGLGVGVLAWAGNGYRVMPSEGGHADFAPVDALQDELLCFLRSKYGRVSYERVVSGRGLPRILEFLKTVAPPHPTAELLHALEGGHPARAISEFALSGRDPVAQRALEIFVSAYGAFAGNMALITLAHGGVYIAGGIAPRIAAKMQDGSFIQAFSAKGRFKRVLDTMPVRVVLNDQVGLLGAIAEAQRLAIEG
jgi:glucokinase